MRSNIFVIYRRRCLNPVMALACWICLFGFQSMEVLLSLASDGVQAQKLVKDSPDPDPNGWQVPDRLSPPVMRNQQIDFFDRPAEENYSANNLPVDVLPNEIRSQIGLANYEEPDEPASWPSGIPEPRQLLLSPGGIQSTLKFSLILGALSLAPAIVLMTTCYIRVIVVLSLLKQAFGGQQLPPTQVITALSLFLTFLIMAPVWNEVKTRAIDPYSAEEISWEQAWNRGVAPIKEFMARQIEMAGNESSVAVFYQYSIEMADGELSGQQPEYLHEVPINVLIPAFMISELKIAFLLGFQIYLPFLVLDLVVSSVSVSMGMFMLPPQLVSFPLKLILFVMVDGWSLVIGMLLQSFVT